MGTVLSLKWEIRIVVSLYLAHPHPYLDTDLNKQSEISNHNEKLKKGMLEFR